MLSIDYGERYIGIAVKTDSGVFPLEPIDRKRLLVIDRLKTLIADYGVTKIIVGVPFGNKSLEKKIKEFVSKVERKIKIKCLLIDETMTSNISEEKMREFGLKSKTIKTKSHSVSAYLLLKTYLDSVKLEG